MTAFVDTNVLVRHLTGDPPTQVHRATRLLQRADGSACADLVLAEVADVLRSYYEAARPVVARSLRAILAFPAIRVVDAELLDRTIEIYEVDGLVFADAYLVASAERSGVGVVARSTRDRPRRHGQARGAALASNSGVGRLGRTMSQLEVRCDEWRSSGGAEQSRSRCRNDLVQAAWIVEGDRFVIEVVVNDSDALETPARSGLAMRACFGTCSWSLTKSLRRSAQDGLWRDRPRRPRPRSPRTRPPRTLDRTRTRSPFRADKDTFFKPPPGAHPRPPSASFIGLPYFEVDEGLASRTSRSSRTPATSRRASRSRPRTIGSGRPNAPASSPSTSRARHVTDRVRVRRGRVGVAVRPVPGRDEGHRDVRRRPLPGPRARGGRDVHPRLQPCLPPVVRLRLASRVR